MHRAGYRLLLRPSGPSAHENAPAATSPEATEPSGEEAQAAKLPDKPSVAVMPLRALSGHATEALIAEGIARDVMVALARARWLFVSARASAAVVASKTSDTSEVSRRLGVRYVLDGAVIVSADRLRLSVTLTDAIEGGEVWGERFDGGLDELFTVMDNIAGHVAGAVEAEIEHHERQRALLRPLASLDAWGAYHRAMHSSVGGTGAELDAAIGLFSRALELDPNSSRVLSGFAALHARRCLLVGEERRGEELERAAELAKQSIAADSRDPQACLAFGRVCTLRGDRQQATRHLSEAVRLNPSLSHGHFYLGYSQMFSRDYDDALARVDAAERLSPYDPMTFAFVSLRAQILSLRGEVEAGADWAERALDHPNAHFQNLMIAAWCCARADRLESAARHATAARKLRPDFKRQDYLKAFMFDHNDSARIDEALAVSGF
ncbi:MAG: hypothetical protein AAGE80_04985 [Pseudomonadota bacterium]